MRNFILWKTIFMLLSTMQCLAQEKETATYAVYPYTNINLEKLAWNLTLPEQEESSIESFIRKIENDQTPNNIEINHAGRTSIFNENQERGLTLFGWQESQVMHRFENPIIGIQGIWEQNLSAMQQTFFGTRHCAIESISIGKGTLTIDTDKKEVTLIRSCEFITESSLTSYRKIRVCHYFIDKTSKLPLFQTVTDTLYNNNDQEKRVISYSLYRKQLATGIENNTNSINLQVYPNPTKGSLFIENPSTEASIVEIYDLTGALCLRIDLKSGHNEISIHHLNTGSYLLKYISKSVCNSIKIIKL